MPKGYYCARNWTQAELLALDEMMRSGRSDKSIARALGRSVVAVQVKRKRVGLSSRRELFLSGRDVATMLGVGCEKTITWWVEQGWLRARRGNGAGRHRRWFIREESLFEFVGNPACWHLWVYEHSAPEIKALFPERGQERFLTPSEVAGLYHVRHAAVNDWIHSGVLRAVRRGNWLIPASALKGFVPPNQRSKKGQKLRRWHDHEDYLLSLLRNRGLPYSKAAQVLGRTTSSVADRWYRLKARLGTEAAFEEAAD